MHTLFLAPTGFGGGLNSISLGLIRALESAGLKVGFFKPIAQPFPVDQGRERSCILVERTLNLTSPEPLPLEQVERQLADGEIDLLLEDVVSRFQQVAVGKDVVIVEGMVPTRESNYTQRINTQLAKSLDAEVILIAAQGSDSLKRLAERIEIQAQLYGGAKDPKVLGVILNKVKTEEGLPAFVDSLKQHLPLLGSADFQLLGAIPFSEELNALRTRDIAELLGAQVLNAGEADQRRVNKIVLCARAVPNTVQLLRSGVLVVTPGDRDDIILAASLASLNGEKLAGLLLCSDFAPDPRILELCKAALDGGLPVMTVETNSYDTANNLFGLASCACRRRRSAISWSSARRTPTSASSCRKATSRAPSAPPPSARSAALPAACCWPSRRKSSRSPASRASPCRPAWKSSIRTASPTATSSRCARCARPRA